MTDLPEQETIHFADLTPDVSNDKGLIFGFADTVDPMSTVDVFVNTDTVIMKTNTHTSGTITARDGTVKNWHKWKITNHLVFSLKKQKFGKPLLRIYKVTKPRYARRTQIRDITSGYLAGRNTAWHLGNQRNLDRLDAALKDGTALRNYPQHHGLELPVLFALWHVFKKYSERVSGFDLNKNSASAALVQASYPATQLFEGTLLDFAPDLAFASSLWLNEPDLRPFIQKGFGKKALRKDFIKALSSTNSITAMNLAHHLKNVVPVDWLIKILQTPEQYIITQGMAGKLMSESFMSHHHFKYLRWFLKQLTPAQQKRFLLEKNLEDYGTYWSTMRVRDSIYMMNNTMTKALVLENLSDLVKSSNWEQLHGNLIILKRDMTLKPQPVPQTGITPLLDEKVFTHEGVTYTIRSPKINQELIRWGNELNNCIASYSDRVVKEYTKVFAVYKEDGTLYANLEVQENHLVQFVEKNNYYVREALRTQMQELIQTAYKKAAKKKPGRAAVEA